MEDKTIDTNEEYKIMKMFDIAQVPIVDYIIYVVNHFDKFTKGDYTNIFNFKLKYEELVKDPLILDMGTDNFIRVDYNIKNSISDNLEDKHQSNDLQDISDDILNFIFQVSLEAFNMVYRYIVDKYVVNEETKILLDTIHFELDSKTMKLLPISISNNRRKLFSMQEYLGKINNQKTIIGDDGMSFYDKMSDENKKQLEEVEKKINDDINVLKDLCSNVEDEEYKQFTEKLLESKNIHIVLKKITKNEIPESLLVR